MRSSRARMLLAVWSMVVFAFLYAPLLIMMIFSFNDSRFNAVWRGFTWRWYMELLGDVSVLEATTTSLIVAGFSTAGATVLGTALALSLHFRPRWGRQLGQSLLYVAVALPEIILGVALLVLFVQLGQPLGLGTVVVGHITLAFPFVALLVTARLQGFDPALHEAALDLGATWWQTLWHITLPLTAPGIIAGALLALTLSIDDFLISFFTAGVGATTLPVKIYSMAKFGLSPVVNALSTLLLILTAGLIATVLRVQRR